MESETDFTDGGTSGLLLITRLPSLSLPPSSQPASLGMLSQSGVKLCCAGRRRCRAVNLRLRAPQGKSVYLYAGVLGSNPAQVFPCLPPSLTPPTFLQYGLSPTANN